ncbi:D-alanyl-D-alanine carboxypeptidase [Streptomyces sp. SID8379]|uniref:D-alanyl-D-alanine carboxypeptidase n=1 Tax=unclassified Streptomyces TaxID=2593676 RepID=UPI00037166CC|nr:D-alanyl-D-alanine carboxypeptidase [Streptomyces sp. HmicA12]MYW69296.1 D-alanyl-D-alanine carboxypeptidase [Streptomyces sp. SID8379]
MAGTPDRSGEEQKASGGPVPDKRDPRIAVARETPSASGVDQATAVFSVRDVAAADAGSGPAAAAEEAGEAGSPSEAAGDARLRAAVAAWVSGGDGGAESDADGSGDADEAGTDAEAAPSADADAETESESEPESESDPSGEAGEPVAAVAEDSGAAEASDDDATDRPEPAAAAAAAEPETEPTVDADAAEAESAVADDSVSDADAEPESAAPEEPAAASKPPAGDDDGDGDGDGDGDADSDDEDKPEPSAVADAKPAESKPDTSDDEADATDATDAGAAEPEPDAAKAQGTDQPTTVFKAVAPLVDQPTTMLKAPGAKTPEAKPSDAKPSDAKPSWAKASGTEESEAERTSRFVPLKPLDDKAAPGAPAAPGTGKKSTGQPAEPPAPERTTQQPLPPKPPLDLLAELTNTPPPPETRVRTTVRRVKVWTPLVLLLVVVFAVVQAVRPLPTPTLDLTAQETVSFEGGKPSVPWPSQGQAAMDVNGIGTFGTSGNQKPVPIASIAKVMTVYLILRDHPLKPGEKGPKIPVDAAAQKHYETGKAENESVVKVTEGQQISEYEALQAVMLPSANNIAKLLARWDTKSSSEDAFVDKMNKTAKELGMKSTTYTDPSGLDKTTVSTAQDLVKLGRAAMENPVFKEISRQPSYVDLNGDKQNNFFGLVPTVAIGIKTGTTTAAGGNILFAAERKVDGKTQTIIGAALGQYGRNGTANIDEVTGVVKKLIESGQSALTAKTVVKKGDVVGQVDDGLGGTTPVVATKDVSAVGWSGLTVRLTLDEQKGKTIPHSAKAGTQVGVLSVGDGKNDADAVEVPVALQKDLTEPGFGAKLRRVG